MSAQESIRNLDTQERTSAQYFKLTDAVFARLGALQDPAAANWIGLLLPEKDERNRCSTRSVCSMIRHQRLAYSESYASCSVSPAHEIAPGISHGTG